MSLTGHGLRHSADEAVAPVREVRAERSWRSWRPGRAAAHLLRGRAGSRPTGRITVDEVAPPGATTRPQPGGAASGRPGRAGDAAGALPRPGGRRRRVPRAVRGVRLVRRAAPGRLHRADAAAAAGPGSARGGRRRSGVSRDADLRAPLAGGARDAGRGPADPLRRRGQLGPRERDPGAAAGLRPAGLPAGVSERDPGADRRLGPRSRARPARGRAAVADADHRPAARARGPLPAADGGRPPG